MAAIRPPVCVCPTGPRHNSKARWDSVRCVGANHTAIRFVSMSFALARPWRTLDGRQRCGCTHYTARANTYTVRIGYFSGRLRVHMCRHTQQLGARGDQRTVT